MNSAPPPQDEPLAGTSSQDAASQDRSSHSAPPENDSPSPARPTLEQTLAQQLASITDAGLRRGLRRIHSAQGPTVSLDGRETLLLCSNNYLGLADHPDVVAAAVQATERFGASAVSSRLISGHMSEHAELEERIAAWKRTEASLVFSTGYQANIGVIASLVGRGDLVISDELNHASIIDGCRLSRADVAVYRHSDTDHLREILASRGGLGPSSPTSSSSLGAAPIDDHPRRVLVITESLFSMDGDLAPLRGIAAITQDAGAWLMVDEAHSTGVFGPRGAGVVADLGLTDQIDIQIGTLGKALGSFGAYVAGSRLLVDFLVNRARAFIFTTGLPPAVAAAARAAIDVIEREPERARGLLQRSRALGLRLRDAGLDVPCIDSQILPIMIGEADRAVAVANRLLDGGVYVAAIRPPTVPAGTSRLRLSLMATHTDQQLAQAADAIIQAVADETNRTKQP